MARDRGEKGRDVSSTLPRNTVTLWLDGCEEEFCSRYENCQLHYRYWLLCHSAFCVQYGNRLIYTTPEGGTFFYVVRYQKHYVTLVIDARQGWLLGFMNAQGAFQMKLEDMSDLYMDTIHCELLDFEANHSQISPRGTGNTLISLRWLRQCVITLSSYKGPKYLTPRGFHSAIGLKVILLLEAKFTEIFLRNYSTFSQQKESILGNDWVTLLITNWSALSQQIMKFLDDIDHNPHDCNIKELKTLDQLLEVLFYLHLDGYNKGIFAHDPLPPAPRTLTWAPVDHGEGDGDIFKPVEPKNPGVLLCQKRVHTKGPPGIHPAKKRKGLSGGGLGGTPMVPECFKQWKQKNDPEQCQRMVSHLQKLGLQVMIPNRDPNRAPCYLIPKAKSDQEDARELEEPIESCSVQMEEDVAEMQEDCSNKTDLSNELEWLQEPNFLSDQIITFSFNNMASQMSTDEVLLLEATVPYLLTHAPDDAALAAETEKLDLRSRRLVLLPINDNDNPAQADGGQHWSLLVIDQRRRDHPVFIHYDSAEGVNKTAADILYKRLRPHLPGQPALQHAKTPQQKNGYDCALYVISIAREICRWWINRALAGNNDSWSAALTSQVNTQNVDNLRTKLIDMVKSYLSKLKVSGNES